MIDDRLRLLVERIERLLEERRGISDDIREVYAEAKAVGYDPAMVRKLIARRAMKPDDRHEADALLQVYEAALGLTSEATPSIADLRPDAAQLAVNLLAEEIVALENPGQARLLVDHVLFLLDLRAEIRELRRQESDRKKLAGSEGFEPKHIATTVRWFEKVARFGEEAMRAGEAVFHLYRATVDTTDHGGKPTTDAKLAALFGPAARKPTARSRALRSAMANARAARAAHEGEL